MNLQQQTQNVAAQGRYGDSMLMHVNPEEVRGLAQVMPITVNPETGQPEAFLPFLLPLLGTLGGSAMAGAGMLGGMSALTAGAIGSGLGTWAATGDIKKGILGGITGYGLGSVLGAGKTAAQAAQATAAATPSVATANMPFTIDASGIMTPAAAGATLPSAAAAATAAKAAAGSGLSAGLKAAGTQLMQPSSYIPLGVGLGGLGTMQSQEQFQQAMANLAANDTEEYNRILAEHPEYVPMLQGNQAYARGGAVGKEFKPTSAVQARDIDPNYMAGFQGERGYLKNVNPSSGQIVSGKTGYDFGTEFSDAPMSAPFDPTQTAGYKGFYNAPREPYVLDPYAEQTFTQPEAPIIQPIVTTPPPPQETEPAPIFVPPASKEPVPPFNPADAIVNEIPGGGPIENVYASGLSREGTEESSTGVPMDGVEDILSNPYSFPVNPSSVSPNMNAIADYNDYLGSTGMPVGSTGMPMGGAGMPDMSGLSQEEIESGSFDPSMLEPPPSMPMPEEVIEPEFQPFGGRGGSNNPFDMLSDDVSEDTVDVYSPPEPVRKTRPIGGGKGGGRRGGGRRGKAAGGQTDLPNKGLEALNQVAPNVVDKMGFQEGGMLTDQLSQNAIMNDPITQNVVLFILGESEDDESVNNFIEKYGSDAFMQLRDTILKTMTNQDVQTEGLITGTGEGGMSDNIPMDVSGTPAAVSQGEFIVPSDVVSMLGDGDTDSGGNELYAMMDRVRKTKTGTTQQAPRLANAGGLMPA